MLQKSFFLKMMTCCVPYMIWKNREVLLVISCVQHVNGALEGCDIIQDDGIFACYHFLPRENKGTERETTQYSPRDM